MLPKRTPIPKPDGPVDPRLEAAAAAALSQARGKAVWKGAPPQAGALAAAIIRARIPPKGGKTVLELKRQWRDIVGDKLAAMTEPEKIARGAAGKTLTVKVAGPAAPFVQHQAALILERCNLAGADIRDIAIKQGVIGRKATTSNVRPLAAPLSADEERLLAQSLDAIGAPDLKAALLRLGRAVGQKR